MSKYEATITISMLYKRRYIEICASRRAQAICPVMRAILCINLTEPKGECIFC